MTWTKLLILKVLRARGRFEPKTFGQEATALTTMPEHCLEEMMKHRQSDCQKDGLDQWKGGPGINAVARVPLRGDVGYWWVRLAIERGGPGGKVVW